MKLSTIAISVAVIIGGAAVGGSWYTGSQVEQRYNEFVEMGNATLKQLAVYGVDAQLKNVKFERGFFSSNVSYQLEAKADKESVVFEGKDKLFHGPFPLNRLTQGKITPMLMSAESHVSVPEKFKGYFARPELLNALTHINYSGDTSGQFSLSSVKIDDLKLTLAETAGEFEVEKSGKYDISAKLPSMIADDQNIKVQLEDVEYKIQGKNEQANNYPHLTVGDYEMKVKAMNVVNSEAAQNGDIFNMHFENIVSKGYAKIKDAQYISEGKADMQMSISTKESKFDLGKANMDMSFKGDAASFDKIYAIYPQLAKDPENEQVMDEIQDAAKAFLVKPFSFHLNDISLENSKGKNELGLKFNFDLPNFEQLGDFAEILNGFKQSELSTKLNLASIKELAVQFYSLNPETKANAENLANQSIEQLVSSSQESGLVEVDSENVKLKLEIDQGKVKLNGNEVPEEQVQTALFMIALSLGSLGM